MVALLFVSARKLFKTFVRGVLKFDGMVCVRYSGCAGWSSLVARRAHNPKVVSSNLTPATMGAYEANPLSALLNYSYELSRKNPFA